jgi:hypothetical protein
VHYDSALTVTYLFLVCSLLNLGLSVLVVVLNDEVHLEALIVLLLEGNIVFVINPRPWMLWFCLNFSLWSNIILRKLRTSNCLLLHLPIDCDELRINSIALSSLA